MIDDNLSVLRDYQRLGVRYLTLSHSVNTNWSDSSGDKPAHNGLTDFGKDVVRELNRLGVMVDISHVADKTFWDALETSKAPLVASHSSLRSISGHPRNMTDDMITALGAKGGVIMINYSTSFLSNELYEAGLKNAAQAERPRVSWEKIVEHIDRAVKLVGATHVGLGSDFDGTTVPDGMEDASQLPKITAALLAKGYSEQDVKNILGENILRLLEKVDAVGREIRAAAGRFIISFTAAIDKTAAARPENYEISGYTRKWQGAYATPDSGRHKLEIRSVDVAVDRLSVVVHTSGQQEGHVYEINCGKIGPAGQESLWPSAGYYTLNQMPAGDH